MFYHTYHAYIHDLIKPYYLTSHFFKNIDFFSSVLNPLYQITVFFPINLWIKWVKMGSSGLFLAVIIEEEGDFDEIEGEK